MSATSVDKPSDKEIAKKFPDSADHVLHVEDVRKGNVEEAFDNSIDDTKPSRAAWMIVFTVAMGGFLFGKDSERLPDLRDDDVMIHTYQR